MELGLTRRNVGRLVLLAWAVALAWLARRQFTGTGSAATAERARRLQPGAEYFAVLAGGRQIGQLNLTADTLVDGVRLTRQLVLDLPRGDSTRQLARGEQYYLTRALRLQNYTRTDFGIGTAERLEVALGSDSLLHLLASEGANDRPPAVILRADREAILPGMLSYHAAFGGHLHVGERFTLPLIDLGRNGTRELTVRVTAESTFVIPDSTVWDSLSAQWVPATSDTVQAWRLEHDAGGAPTVSWVDAGGALVREEVSGGFTLVRSAFEMINVNYRHRRQAESSAWRRGIPGMTSLVASGRVADPRSERRRYLWRPDSTSGGPPPAWSGGRQSWQGDTVSILRELPPQSDSADAAAELARGPAWDLPVRDRDMAVAAAEALQGARTADDSIAALTRWVARQIATDTTLAAFGTARNALRARRAGPDGKARLLATLARVSGIPAREVAGLAVLPQGSLSHSWAELWERGRWIAADPSYGQLPASTLLVRVTVGTRSRPLDLLPLVGSARFLPLGSAP
jgi:Transglutaminase-like superfamily